MDHILGYEHCVDRQLRNNRGEFEFYVLDASTSGLDFCSAMGDIEESVRDLRAYVFFADGFPEMNDESDTEATMEMEGETLQDLERTHFFHPKSCQQRPSPPLAASVPVQPLSARYLAEKPLPELPFRGHDLSPQSPRCFTPKIIANSDTDGYQVEMGEGDIWFQNHDAGSLRRQPAPKVLLHDKRSRGETTKSQRRILERAGMEANRNNEQWTGEVVRANVDKSRRRAPRWEGHSGLSQARKETPRSRRGVTEHTRGDPVRHGNYWMGNTNQHNSSRRTHAVLHSSISYHKDGPFPSRSRNDSRGTDSSALLYRPAQGAEGLKKSRPRTADHLENDGVRDDKSETDRTSFDFTSNCKFESSEARKRRAIYRASTSPDYRQSLNEHEEPHPTKETSECQARPGELTDDEESVLEASSLCEAADKKELTMENRASGESQRDSIPVFPVQGPATTDSISGSRSHSQTIKYFPSPPPPLDMIIHASHPAC